MLTEGIIHKQLEKNSHCNIQNDDGKTEWFNIDLNEADKVIKNVIDVIDKVYNYENLLSQGVDDPPLRRVILPVTGDDRVVIRTFMSIHVSESALLLNRVRVVTEGRQDPYLGGVLLPVTGDHRVVIRTLMSIQIASIAFLLDGMPSL